MLKHPFATVFERLHHIALALSCEPEEVHNWENPHTRVFRGITYQRMAPTVAISREPTNNAMVFRGSPCEQVRAPRVAPEHKSRQMIYRGTPYCG